MTVKLIERFQDSGYVVVRHSVTDDEVERIKDRLRALLPRGTASPTTPLQRMVPCIVELDQGIADFATSRQLCATVADLFGLMPQLVCSYGHEKPARTDAHTGPHSDVAHLAGVPHDRSLLMVKAMLALTPIRDGSGGTVIVPGSHRQQGSDGLGTYVSMEPGDLLLFHANVLHTATANATESPRLSIWFVFALPWMRLFPGYEHSAHFVDQLRPRFADEPHLRTLLGLDDPYATNRP